MIAAAEKMAASLVRRADRLRTRAQRQRSDQMRAMVTHPASRDFMIELADEVLRIEEPRAAARRFADLVQRQGAPGFTSRADGLILRAAAMSARVTPELIAAQLRSRVRREVATVVLDASRVSLSREISARDAAGIVLNVNPLGETVLSDREADARLHQALELLERPEISHLSIKASAIRAGLDVFDLDGSVSRVADAFEILCQAARRPASSAFVNLDTEEYADLWPTVGGFIQALERPGLETFHAGIALQAYLPDSLAAFSQLSEWALKRTAAGGAPIKIRLVKGANLATERVDAELHGWNPAPLPSKAEVDANYKRMVDRALQPELASSVRIGVASHNLFDIAWALCLAADRDASDQLDIEMLHGISDAEALAVAERVSTAGIGQVVLYTPVVEAADFPAATAYLVRRFDENTSPENFLTHLPGLTIGSDAWQEQVQRFRDSVTGRHLPDPPVRRAQLAPAPSPGTDAATFVNAADSDFTQETVRARARKQLAEFTFPDFTRSDLTSSEDDVARAVVAAVSAASGWCGRGTQQRRETLRDCAAALESQRFTTIAAMVQDAGRTVREADPEVSAAIDAARYYGQCAAGLSTGHDSQFEPYGVTVVASPANSPYAVPAGGVFAALAAGSTVILMPSPGSVRVALVLAEQCWQAGVPRDVLQVVLASDPGVERALITHPDVDAVILTGRPQTAHQYRSWRPELRLHAHLGGTNAIVVTAGADLDDAVRDIVRSAFGQAGQDRAAASLVIAEASVLDGTRFLERLADAARSLRVGPAQHPATQLGPLIRPPDAALHRVLTELDDGETWLVEPAPGAHDSQWTPGIRLGVEPGSRFHLTEFAGPVLGVMRAQDLDDAIDLQNQVPGGLTGGIFSLDDREVDRWLDRAQAGNLYVNRQITGAVVGRQPFGGWKRSAFGTGIKAGGPFYVASLGRWVPSGGWDAAAAEHVCEAACQLWAHWSAGVDVGGLSAEQNLLRLRPLPAVLLRAGAGVTEHELAVAETIARELEIKMHIVSEDDLSDDEFISAAISEEFDRIRLIGTHSPGLLAALAHHEADPDLRQVSADPAMELLCWTREQTITRTLHRHGNPRPVRHT